VPDPIASASDAAYAHLRSLIISGKVRPGERILESEIASRAKVSRTPVREALRRLSADGLVEIAANKGARVTPLGPQERAEIFSLRCLIEPFAAGEAAHRATPEQVRQLRGLCYEMEEVAGRISQDWAQQLTILNREFHGAVVEAAGMRRLVTMANSLMEPAIISLTFSKYSDVQLQRSMQHHSELTSAISSGDARWASSIMSAHLLAASAVKFD
jgi:DNA-binding GntR family transcriptional regulator